MKYLMKHVLWVRIALIAISLIIVGVGLVSGNVNAMINWTIGLLFLTTGILIILSIYSSAQDPKSAGRSMVGLVSILVVLGISYAMSDTTPVQTAVHLYDNPTDLIIADTGIYATYIVAFLAVASIAGTELYKLIKK